MVEVFELWAYMKELHHFSPRNGKGIMALRLFSYLKIDQFHHYPKIMHLQGISSVVIYPR